MREQVCIVLNEREPSKARVAETLAARLKDYNITTSRIAADQHVLKTLLERSPRVLVLDYLLGDYTTGLDVFSGILESRLEHKPAVFFLTDEPGISVAVEAMRLGALDYLEIENPQALSRLARLIYEITLQSKSERDSRETPPPSLSELIDNSQIAARLIRQARVLAEKKPPVIVIHGNTGTGRGTLARAIIREESDERICKLLDLTTFSGTFGKRQTGANIELPSFEPAPGGSTIILNADHDDGTCHTYFCENIDRLWPGRPVENCASALLVCVNSQETFALWQKFPGAQTLLVPSLADRKDDIPFLAQKFLREAQELGEVRIKQLTGSILTWLQSLKWPGEIAQLRACVMHAAIATSFSEEDLRSLIEEQRTLWEETAGLSSNLKLNRFTAARVLELSSSSYRIAAARLGCAATKLKELLEDQ